MAKRALAKTGYEHSITHSTVKVQNSFLSSVESKVIEYLERHPKA